MDTGLQALVALARYYEIPAEPEQLTHEYGSPGEVFGDTEVLLASKALTLKAKLLKPDVNHLSQGVLPAIAKSKKGDYFILVKVITLESEDECKEPPSYSSVIIQDLSKQAPETIDKTAFLELWSGEIIAVTRRASLTDTLQSTFDITWFIPSLIKYRRLFLEVVVASFFLQLFALVVPLFFQVVMDKVLVHRGFTTLDVLAVGFFVVVVFDALLGGVRNYTFSHTANRIDVELGARLYNHLMALPLLILNPVKWGKMLLGYVN